MEEIIFKITADTGTVDKNVKKTETVMTELNNSYKKVTDSSKTLAEEQASNEKATLGLEQRMKALTEKLNQSGLTMQDYTQSIKQYQSIALEAGRTSPIGKDALKQVSALQDKIGDLGNETSGFALRMKALTEKLNQGGLTMRDYTQTIKQYQSIALEAGRTSPIGRDALNQASALQDKIGDLRNETSRLADDHKNLSGVIGVASGVTAGYGAVQGAMALVGGESEALQKTMVKMQAVQSILNGLQAVKQTLEAESAAMLLLINIRTKAVTLAQTAQTFATTGTTVATRLLGVSMLALPIVAIIAGIVALVAAVAYFVSGTQTAEEENKKLTASMEKQSEAFDRNSSKVQKNTQNKIDLAKSAGASSEQLFKMEMGQLAENEALRKQNVANEKKNLQDLQANYRTALSEDNEEQAKSTREQIAATRTKYKDLKALDGQFFVDKTIAQNNENTRLKGVAEKDEQKIESDAKAGQDRAKAFSEKRKAQEEKDNQLKADREKLMGDLMVANIEDVELRSLMALQLGHTRERAELVKKFGEDTILLKDLQGKQDIELTAFNLDLAAKRQAQKDTITAEEKAQQDERLTRDNNDKKSRLEGELIAMQEDFFATQEIKAELALLEREVALQDKELTEGELFLIEQTFQEKKNAIAAENADREKQIQQESFDSAVNFAQQGANAIGQLSDVVFLIKSNNLKKGSAEELASAKKQFRLNKALQLAQAGMDAFKAITSSLSVSPLTILGVPNPGAIASLAFTAITSATNIAKIAATKFQGGGGGGGGGVPSVSVPAIPNPVDVSGGVAGGGNSTLTNERSNIKVNVVDSDIKASLAQSEKVNVLSSIGG